MTSATDVKTAAPSAETAVRNYLLFLEDPSQLIDKDEVVRLEEAVRSSSDPLEKLRAINRLKQIHDGDRDAYRQTFCAHAKTWAEDNEIHPSAFLELGVDEATLRAAGFSLRGATTSSTSVARSRRAPAGRGQVKVEQVKGAVRRQSGEFTLADIAAASGASPMTIRKAVEELVAAGDVERLGPTPNWSQPGRAPIQFRPISKRARK